MAGANLELSQVHGDFDSLVNQLQNHLVTKDAWSGFLTTQTGETLLEMVAAVGALNQMRLLRYYQDAFPFTALSDTAVYAIASMQGVRINRKASMGVAVNVSSPDGEVIIPELTIFSVAGTPFFNRQAVTITPTPQVITLYEGVIERVLTRGVGSFYQTFITKEANFIVSDEDVKVRINGEEIEKTWDGMWKLSSREGYRDRTLPDGRLQLEFGNDRYGSNPTVNDEVEIIYVVTQGTAVQSLKTLDRKVTCDQFPSVEGEAVSNPTGGGEETDPELYKNLSAAQFGNFGSAVTKQQYQNTALSYAGVVDAKTFAQRESNANAVEWMNLIKVVLLTTTPWSQTDKDGFLDYMYNNTMYSTRLFLEDPVAMPVDIRMTIGCYSWANASDCQASATAAVQELFRVKPGSLSRDTFRSDIHDVVMASNSGIEYVVLESPRSDLMLSGASMEQPTVTAGTPNTGAIPVGTYYYAVSPVITLNGQQGEIPPTRFLTVVNSIPNTTMTIRWIPYEGASHYRVWGRSANNIGRLATVSAASSAVAVDDGTFTPTVQPPAVSTVPVRYNTIQSLNVTAIYSSRSQRGSI